MKMYSTKFQLPADNQYVLCHLTLTNWFDSDDPNGDRYWKVLKFKKGISKKERKKLPATDPRKKQFYIYDEGGNNKVSYAWKAFGPDSYFGQDVDRWTDEFHDF